MTHKVALRPGNNMALLRVPHTYGAIVAKLGYRGCTTTIGALLQTMARDGLGHIADQVRDHLNKGKGHGLTVEFADAEPAALEHAAAQAALDDIAARYRNDRREL